MAQNIPQDFIDEVLSKVDITDVIGKSVSLKKEGQNFVALCPFHQEKTPSFKVSAQKQIYHCFGCGVGGNALSFLMKQGQPFYEALKTLADSVGMTLPQGSFNPQKTQNQQDGYYEVMSQVSRFYQIQLREHPAAHEARDYLISRGFSEEMIQKFGLGYAPPGWDHLVNHFRDEKMREHLLTLGLIRHEKERSPYDLFRGRVIIPIRNQQGKIVALGGRVLDDSKPKYLNSPENPIFHKSQELYGLYEALTANRARELLLVVEGYMDVMALVQHGLDYTVGTLGTATTSLHINRLFRWTSQVVFCFDGDAAGQSAAWRALEGVLPVLRDEWQIRFVFLPEGEDPDTLVRKIGRQNFEVLIQKATPLTDFFFQELRKKVNLNHGDGRSKYASLAMNYLQKMPVGIKRDILVQALSQEIHVSPNHLMKYLEVQNSPVSLGSLVSATAQPRPSIVKKAMMFLLQHPALVEHVPASILEQDVVDAEVFFRMIDILKANPGLSTGALLEYFREEACFDQLCGLATEILNPSLPQIELEFQSMMDRLRILSISQSIEKLMAKANTEGLSLEEKRQLQQLLKKKQGG